MKHSQDKSRLVRVTVTDGPLSGEIHTALPCVELVTPQPYSDDLSGLGLCSVQEIEGSLHIVVEHECGCQWAYPVPMLLRASLELRGQLAETVASMLASGATSAFSTAGRRNDSIH